MKKLRKAKYRLGLSPRFRLAWSVWGYNDRLRRDVLIMPCLTRAEATRIRALLEERCPARIESGGALQ